MYEGPQLTGQTKIAVGRFFSFATVAAMILIISVASLTSRQMFSQIYQWAAELLRVSGTSLSMSLWASPVLGHFLCYVLLSLSLSAAFSPRNKLLAPLAAVTFGVLMEIGQIPIPSRDASFMDIGINSLGVVVGFLLYRLWTSFIITHQS